MRQRAQRHVRAAGRGVRGGLAVVDRLAAVRGRPARRRAMRRRLAAARRRRGARGRPDGRRRHRRGGPRRGADDDARRRLHRRRIGARGAATRSAPRRGSRAAGRPAGTAAASDAATTIVTQRKCALAPMSTNRTFGRSDRTPGQPAVQPLTHPFGWVSGGGGPPAGPPRTGRRGQSRALSPPSSRGPACAPSSGTRGVRPEPWRAIWHVGCGCPQPTAPWRRWPA